MSLSTQSDILKNTTDLRKKHQGWPQELYGIIASQKALRAKAIQKFKYADKMLFTQKSLEQSTSETIATSINTLIKPVDRIIEICSGIGGNTIGLQDVCKNLTCVDSSALLNQFHQHNLSLYPSECNIKYFEDLAENLDYNESDLVFCDPDRRSTNNQRLNLDDFSPDLPFLENLAEQKPLILKMSPLWDLSEIPKQFSSIYISENNELKQCLWYTSEAFVKKNSCLIIKNNRLYNDENLKSITQNSTAETHIHVANPVLLKTRLGQNKIEDLNLQSLSPNPRFFIGNLAQEAPFFETYKILSKHAHNLKDIKQIIKESKNVRFEFRGDKSSLLEFETIIKKGSQLSGPTLTIFLFKSKQHKQVYLTSLSTDHS